MHTIPTFDNLTFDLYVLPEEIQSMQ